MGDQINFAINSFCGMGPSSAALCTNSDPYPGLYILSLSMNCSLLWSSYITVTTSYVCIVYYYDLHISLWPLVLYVLCTAMIFIYITVCVVYCYVYGQCWDEDKPKPNELHSSLQSTDFPSPECKLAISWNGHISFRLNICLVTTCFADLLNPAFRERCLHVNCVI